VSEFRTFGNFDPPIVADLWNNCLTEPGAATIRTPTVIEFFTFAKPYFDPEGLLLALSAGQPVGFAHSGFGPRADGRAVDSANGVVCALGVLPDFRRQGIGTALLVRSEDYLRARGARQLFAGPFAPANPFTFGLYGGSQSSGFLDSSSVARPFLEGRGYHPCETAIVYRCPVERASAIVDGRFPTMRQRYEVVLQPRRGLTWYEESVVGPVELHEFHLRDKVTGRQVVRTCVWEMETFGPRWGEHGVGILDVETAPDVRRRGLGKFLMSMLLRHLREQFFTLVEAHAPETNEAANNLLQSAGFVRTDTGRRFKRQ
jgi:ribosomal protein S18 acetylase RimI-like enzyme